MKKLFKRFLCVIGFTVLSVICAHADTSVLVVNQLTPTSFPLIEGMKSVDLYFNDDESSKIAACVRLFSKKDGYVVLSVNSDLSAQKECRSKNYWLRKREELSEESKKERSVYILGTRIGLINQIASIQRNHSAQAVQGSSAADEYDESLSDDPSECSGDSSFIELPCGVSECSPAKPKIIRKFKVLTSYKGEEETLMLKTSLNKNDLAKLFVSGAVLGIEEI